MAASNRDCAEASPSFILPDSAWILASPTRIASDMDPPLPRPAENFVYSLARAKRAARNNVGPGRVSSPRGGFDERDRSTVIPEERRDVHRGGSIAAVRALARREPPGQRIRAHDQGQ